MWTGSHGAMFPRLLLSFRERSEKSRRDNITTSYLLVADAFVCVVQLVGDDVSVASEGFIPAQRHRGWRV